MNILLTADWLVRTTYYILRQHLDDLGANTKPLRGETIVAIFDEAQDGGQHLGDVGVEDGRGVSRERELEEGEGLDAEVVRARVLKGLLHSGAERTWAA